MSTPKQLKVANKGAVRGLGIKLLIGLPISGLFWTIIFYFFVSNESWNFKILLFFSIFGIFLGGGSIINFAFGSSVYQLWHKLISLIDSIIVWLFLPFFYYFVFFPYSLALRLTGKSKFNQKKIKTSSYWREIDNSKNNKRYLQQF